VAKQFQNQLVFAPTVIVFIQDPIVSMTDVVTGKILTPTFSYLFEVESGTQSAVEALLCLDTRGTLADARARVREAEHQLSGTGRESLERYFSSRLLDMVTLQLSYCLKERALHEPVAAVMRSADRVHAAALDSLVRLLQTDNTLLTKTAKTFEESYLKTRSKLLSVLAACNADLAKPFVEVKPVKFSIPRGETRFKVSSFEYLTRCANDLRREVQSSRSSNM
jgi:hypothetical protein